VNQSHKRGQAKTSNATRLTDQKLGHAAAQRTRDDMQCPWALVVGAVHAGLWVGAA